MALNLLFHYNSDNETPAPVAGDPTSFTLAHTPEPTTSLMLFNNGLLQYDGYTLSGTKLKLNWTPGPGDNLRVFYRY